MAKGTSFWERFFSVLDIFFSDDKKEQRRKEREEKRKAKEAFKRYESWRDSR
uniref:Uncharacterized protein n=1 Tax=viral metagenome TaxID=1070528 RepID=A0A6H2A172_9ZZZZ